MRNYLHLTRQMDIIPVDTLKTPINIIGAGAVGSFLTLALTKMGFENITVWDFDTISVENMNCQFFRFQDIDKPKVQALKDLIKDFNGVDIKIENRRYEGGVLDGIVIAALDSMEGRKLILEENFGKKLGTKLFIDPRMASEAGQMYTVDLWNPKEKETYLKAWYSDDDAHQERCTAKSTMYTVLLISGTIASTIVNFVKGQSYPKNILMDTKVLDVVTNLR